MPGCEQYHDKSFLGFEMCRYELSEHDVERFLRVFKDVWYDLLTKIEFSRVYLGRFEYEHINDEYLSWLNDKKLMHYSNQQYFTHTYYFRNYLMSAEKEQKCIWGIWEKQRSKMLGTFSSTVVSDATVDQGILIGDSNQMRGLSFEVWNGMTNYTLDLPQISKVSPVVIRSIRK